MKYMGSKARIAKYILPIILKGRRGKQIYIEPFAGGMNTICEVSGKRIANDINPYLIAMWEALIEGWIPFEITKEKYYDIKNNKNEYLPSVIGWCGFNCSYSGKWFGGFAGKTKTKIGTIRDYQKEAINNVSKQIKKMQGVIFSNESYNDMKIPLNSIIYCDIPYKNTTKYKDDFNHVDFWEWARYYTFQGVSVFVSEYNAPDDFVSIWGKEVKSSLSANGKSGCSKNSVEKLFIHKDLA
jgi:DNA adenine methylase